MKILSQEHMQSSANISIIIRVSIVFSIIQFLSLKLVIHDSNNKQREEKQFELLSVKTINRNKLIKENFYYLIRS